MSRYISFILTLSSILFCLATSTEATVPTRRGLRQSINFGFGRKAIGEGIETLAKTITQIPQKVRNGATKIKSKVSNNPPVLPQKSIVSKTTASVEAKAATSIDVPAKAPAKIEKEGTRSKVSKGTKIVRKRLRKGAIPLALVAMSAAPLLAKNAYHAGSQGASTVSGHMAGSTGGFTHMAGTTGGFRYMPSAMRKISLMEKFAGKEFVERQHWSTLIKNADAYEKAGDVHKAKNLLQNYQMEGKVPFPPQSIELKSRINSMQLAMEEVDLQKVSQLEEKGEYKQAMKILSDYKSRTDISAESSKKFARRYDEVRAAEWKYLVSNLEELKQWGKYERAEEVLKEAKVKISAGRISDIEKELEIVETLKYKSILSNIIEDLDLAQNYDNARRQLEILRSKPDIKADVMREINIVYKRLQDEEVLEDFAKVNRLVYSTSFSKAFEVLEMTKVKYPSVDTTTIHDAVREGERKYLMVQVNQHLKDGEFDQAYKILDRVKGTARLNKYPNEVVERKWHNLQKDLDALVPSQWAIGRLLWPGNPKQYLKLLQQFEPQAQFLVKESLREFEACMRSVKVELATSEFAKLKEYKHIPYEKLQEFESQAEWLLPQDFEYYMRRVHDLDESRMDWDIFELQRGGKYSEAMLKLNIFQKAFPGNSKLDLRDELRSGYVWKKYEDVSTLPSNLAYKKALAELEDIRNMRGKERSVLQKMVTIGKSYARNLEKFHDFGEAKKVLRSIEKQPDISYTLRNELSLEYKHLQEAEWNYLVNQVNRLEKAGKHSEATQILEKAKSDISPTRESDLLSRISQNERAIKNVNNKAWESLVLNLDRLNPSSSTHAKQTYQLLQEFQPRTKHLSAEYRTNFEARMGVATTTVNRIDATAKWQTLRKKIHQLNRDPEKALGLLQKFESEAKWLSKSDQSVFKQEWTRVQKASEAIAIQNQLHATFRTVDSLEKQGKLVEAIGRLRSFEEQASKNPYFKGHQELRRKIGKLEQRVARVQRNIYDQWTKDSKKIEEAFEYGDVQQIQQAFELLTKYNKKSSEAVSASLEAEIRDRYAQGLKQLGALRSPSKEFHAAILGVEAYADKKAIKKAYNAMARAYHPDKHFRNQKAVNEYYAYINNAYDVLLE